MQPALKQEKAAEKTKVRIVRWGVYCIVPWVDDLSRTDADDEKHLADVECECGGKHVVLSCGR